MWIQRQRERERQQNCICNMYIWVYLHNIYIYTNIYNSSRSRRQVMKLDPLDVGGNWNVGKESLSVKTSQIQSYELQYHMYANTYCIRYTYYIHIHVHKHIIRMELPSATLLSSHKSVSFSTFWAKNCRPGPSFRTRTRGFHHIPGNGRVPHHDNAPHRVLSPGWTSDQHQTG